MEGRVDVKILCGKGLIAMDFTGKSDPYVEVYQGSKKLHKTEKKKNTLNPEWNEQFSFHLTDQYERIIFKVLDRDIPDKDDFMGEARLDMTAVGMNRSEEFTLQLTAGDDDQLARKAEKKKISLGLIIVRVCTTDVQDESIEKLDFSATSSTKSSMPFSTLLSNSGSPSDPSGMVHIVMVQARGLIPFDVGSTINSFCKVSLGSGKRKTKIIPDSLNPKWRQHFDIPWFKGQDDFIEMFIHDSKTGGEESDQIGRAFINLRELKQEMSHNLWISIKDRMKGNNTDDPRDSKMLMDNSGNLLNIEKEGELNVIVTISGLLDTKEEVSRQDEEDKLKERFALSNTFANIEDVGHLEVKVIRALGLSPEFIGKRNPFTVLQVKNSRVQTRPDQTIDPEWNTTFKFDIKDVYEILEVAIFDDEGDNDDFPYELLGRIQIPLLNIESGKERWYRLKDHNLRNSAKGEDPRILLQMKFAFNSIRASSCVFKPKSIKYEENHKNEFEISKFKLNAGRMMRVKNKCLTLKQTILNIFEWHNPFVSFCALIVIPAIIWHFDTWMIPAFLLLFLTNQIMKPSENTSTEEDVEADEVDTQDDGNLSMMETLNLMQQKALWMQEGMGEVAGAIESLENVLNFTVPYISWFIYIFIFFITIFLYFAPLRLLVLVWVVNRFRKGLLKNRTDTNEVINFLSRVPDNEELKNYQELDGPGLTRSKSLKRLRSRASQDNVII